MVRRALAVVFTTLKHSIARNLPRLQERCTAECVCIGNSASKFLMDFPQLKKDVSRAKYVTVFHADEADKMEIKMDLYGLARTINRNADEPLAMSLERIKTNLKNANAKLQKKVAKKFKIGTGETRVTPITDNNPVAELLDHDGQRIEESTCNKEAWHKGKTLRLCDLTYIVIYNPPQIMSLKLIAAPLVGMPIHPQIHLRMSSLEHMKFAWYRKRLVVEEAEEMEMDSSEAGKMSETKKHRMSDQVSSNGSSVDVDDDSSWELIGNDKTYTATEDDVGYSLRLTVIPGSDRYPCESNSDLFRTEAVSTRTEGSVIKGPSRCFFDDRILLTKDRCKAGSFRIMSYNILADVYASTEYARDFLFPYCPDDAIDIEYRQQLIIKELTGYNSDIVCLQEVDRSVFEAYYMPAMSIEGYAGAFAAKDATKEGVAMFYQRDKFRLLMVDNIILRKAVKEERNEDIYSKICKNEEFKKSFLSRGTCLLVAVLQSIEDESKHILLGNTHLYWHPRGGQVRLIQTEVALRELRRLYHEHSENQPNQSLACVLTGDLNSQPYTAAIQLLTEGLVSMNHADWFSMGKQERLENVTVHNPMKLESACGYPKYTTLVSGFVGCLDYIFYDPRFLRVSRVVPQPPHDEIVKYTALPNRTAPSDHIAQVADLAWKVDTEESPT